MVPAVDAAADVAELEEARVETTKAPEDIPLFSAFSASVNFPVILVRLRGKGVSARRKRCGSRKTHLKRAEKASRGAPDVSVALIDWKRMKLAEDV